MIAESIGDWWLVVDWLTNKIGEGLTTDWWLINDLQMIVVQLITIIIDYLIWLINDWSVIEMEVITIDGNMAIRQYLLNTDWWLID